MPNKEGTAKVQPDPAVHSRCTPCLRSAGLHAGSLYTHWAAGLKPHCVFRGRGGGGYLCFPKARQPFRWMISVQKQHEYQILTYELNGVRLSVCTFISNPTRTMELSFESSPYQVNPYFSFSPVITQAYSDTLWPPTTDTGKLTESLNHKIVCVRRDIFN